MSHKKRIEALLIEIRDLLQANKEIQEEDEETGKKKERK